MWRCNGLVWVATQRACALSFAVCCAWIAHEACSHLSKCRSWWIESGLRRMELLAVRSSQSLHFAFLRDRLMNGLLGSQGCHQGGPEWDSSLKVLSSLDSKWTSGQESRLQTLFGVRRLISQEAVYCLARLQAIPHQITYSHPLDESSRRTLTWKW